MAEDAEEGALGRRAGCPATGDSLTFKEPSGGAFMHVPRIARGDEDTGAQERDRGRGVGVIRCTSSASSAA